MIIIAHRFCILCHVDQILVFNEGKMVEEGTHSQLINLYHAQEGLVNFDSARQSQIEAQRSDRESHSKTMADEKDRFGKVAASQNSPNLTERGINRHL
jgi:ABC-type transport system involved in cytochrome bd biosynthesis fused ATPase/permease subunit